MKNNDFVTARKTRRPPWRGIGPHNGAARNPRRVAEQFDARRQRSMANFRTRRPVETGLAGWGGRNGAPVNLNETALWARMR